MAVPDHDHPVAGRAKRQHKQFIIDGEAVLLLFHALPFDGLH